MSDVDLKLSLATFVDQQERAYVEALLLSTRGHMQEAAKVAGIDRRTLYRKLRKHDLDKADFKTTEPKAEQKREGVPW